MFSKKEKYLIRDNLKRSTLIKFIYINKLRSSVIHNNFLKKSKLIYLNISSIKNINSKKRKNICLLSGENKSVRKFFLMSRFKINSLCIKNNLQNFKLNSW
jgi:ribosomal protein S14